MHILVILLVVIGGLIVLAALMGLVAWLLRKAA